MTLTHLWSPQQDAALIAVARWLRDPNGPQLFRLFGYAGTGKTTLAKHLAQGVEGDVLFGAFTGKAALVLRRKGCPDAGTIHKMIYLPAGETGGADTSPLYTELSNAQLELDLMPPRVPRDPSVQGVDFKALSANGPRDRLERKISDLRQRILREERSKRKPRFHLNVDSPVRDARLVVIDECSMVDEDMATDLMSFGTKILVLGDPAQLPPVGAGGYFTDAKPDALLTEVHRHALDSGILQLATLVRECEPFHMGRYGDDCEIVAPGNLERRVLDADQVLVGRNKTRHRVNARYRDLTGRGLVSGPLPEAGDKVVCLRNDHSMGLLNGSLWRVHQATHFPDQKLAEMTISSEEDGDPNSLMVSAHHHHFLGMELELQRLGWTKLDNQEFDYGYGLTVHKSQGSQWDDVVLFDESGTFSRDARRWLYTGITRAARKLTVIR